MMNFPLNWSRKALPISLAFIIINIGDASVIYIKDPSVQSVAGDRDLVGVGQNLLHHESEIVLVLPAGDVCSDAAAAMRRHRPPRLYIVRLRRQPPTQAVTATRSAAPIPVRRRQSGGARKHGEDNHRYYLSRSPDHFSDYDHM